MFSKFSIKLTSKVFTLILTSMLGLLVTPAFAADLQLDERGILIGAKDVNVNGYLYDVQFATGTISSVYGGGGTENYVIFDEDPRVASNALFEQVFIDGPLGNFDSDPSLTFGFRNASGYIYNSIFTPQGTAMRRGVFVVRGALLNNTVEEVDDNVEFQPADFDYNYTYSSGNIMLARWSVASSVPEPSNYAMMILGLFSVFLITYRRHS